jgi:hypothetical protein
LAQPLTEPLIAWCAWSGDYLVLVAGIDRIDRLLIGVLGEVTERMGLPPLRWRGEAT